jgi:hypothetical protein
VIERDENFFPTCKGREYSKLFPGVFVILKKTTGGSDDPAKMATVGGPAHRKFVGRKG